MEFLLEISSFLWLMSERMIYKSYFLTREISLLASFPNLLI